MDNQFTLGEYVILKTTPKLRAQVVAFLPDNNVSCLARKDQTFIPIIVDHSLIEKIDNNNNPKLFPLIVG